ncbi:molecular chaperone [Dyella monticola]|uniref:Molecular chaperone n=1 Tax=Dyella monticola TaxID=1927958 RepID=A0A370X4J5_9GAMM|nr:fimbria/pilus periplasmic chaperone [Dyella monticola]RDS83135.1 molecular chaperone [Dyella monticola]
MRYVLRYAMVGVLFVAGGFAARAHADVVISGTRVIYPSQEKEVTVKLNNQGSSPMLVQVWMDDGDDKVTPEKAKTPFTLMPPMFRMEPGKGQAVRVVYTGESLPADKETLFWFNMLEVPPKPKDTEGRNLLQFAFRTRIKFIFRPANLAGIPGDAYKQLSWKLVNDKNGKGLALQATNASSYYVNFAHVGLKINSQREVDQGGMVAPGATAVFPLSKVRDRPSGDVKATFDVINDYGAVAEHDVALGS